MSVDRSLRQIVRVVTRGPNTLTVVVTNKKVFFEEPFTVDPIDVDDPSKGGVPSDHSGVVVLPKTMTNIPSSRQKFVRTVRPITSSAISNIGQVLTSEKWMFMDPLSSLTVLTDAFEYYSSEIINIFCPEKNIYARPDSLPYVTESMKVLKRKIQREYEKKGKSRKYLKLKQLFSQKLISEGEKYKDKITEDVRSGNRSCAYSALRKLGARPGESADNTFALPEHVDNNLSQWLASHF